MTKKFSELRAKMGPAARAESANIAAELRGELPLHQLSIGAEALSGEVTKELEVTQATVSGLEHRPAFQAGTTERITGNPHTSQTLVDALAMPGAEDIDFDPPRLRGPLSRPPDLS